MVLNNSGIDSIWLCDDSGSEGYKYKVTVTNNSFKTDDEDNIYIDEKMLTFSMECALQMSTMTSRTSKHFFLNKLGNYICENREFWRDERFLILEI